MLCSRCGESSLEPGTERHWICLKYGCLVPKEDIHKEIQPTEGEKK